MILLLDIIYFSVSRKCTSVKDMIVFKICV